MKRKPRIPLHPPNLADAIKAASQHAESIPYVREVTSALRLKPAITRFGKRKVKV